MNSDLDASRMHLRMYLDAYVTKVEGVRTCGSDVPFEILNFLIGTINYGGRVTDDKDEKLIMSILNKCYCNDLIDENRYSFSESGLYYVPNCDSLEEVNKYIESLPLDDEPEVFGLNNNANINLQNKLVSELMTPLISIQPRTASAGVKSPDQIVLDIKYDIDNKLKDIKALDVKKGNPESIFENAGKVEAQEDHPKKKKKDNEPKKTPLGNFLVQECEKFNNLLKVMTTSLRSLELAVKGTEVMSPQIEMVYHSFLNGQVPTLWADNAYLSLKPLSGWIIDLIKRFQFMTSWLYDGPPKSYWMSAFFFNQGFVTSIYQTYAVKYILFNSFREKQKNQLICWHSEQMFRKRDQEMKILRFMKMVLISMDYS
ncbi:MAG: hypothetical protein MJ252_15335 [archaeon]|nr:hypothetical protein [archaeon]